MSNQFTTQWLQDLEARKRARQAIADSHKPAQPCDDEAELQSQIIKWCESPPREWVCDWGRMDKPSTRPKGAHDITIFHPGGTICVECKAGNNDCTPEQRERKAKMASAGHMVHVVWNWDQFMDAVQVATNGRYQPHHVD